LVEPIETALLIRFAAPVDLVPPPLKVDQEQSVRISPFFDKSAVTPLDSFRCTKPVARRRSMTSHPTNPAGCAIGVRRNLVPNHVSRRGALARARSCPGMAK
jgi:hypothetical protein